MASNKINTKAKGKDDRNKKNGSPVNEENDAFDSSLLRKPIMTSITGFAQARKIFDLATEELKALLANECDLLYECKVCRNIFRSLANFLSHKRIYCTQKFSSSVHSHFMDSDKRSMMNELIKIRNIENGYQESLKQKCKESLEEDEPIPLSKDLTELVEKIMDSRGVKSTCIDEANQVTLQRIPSSSVAVFQNVQLEEGETDMMRAQVEELEDMLSRDAAVLQSDGSFTVASSRQQQREWRDEDNDDEAESEGVIQISDDDDAQDIVLKCNICDMKFSTRKTLRFHTRQQHVVSRLVYPCPECVDIFSTPWSVNRHLFKVHRKSLAQIRRLRESILTKAFRMNNPPAFYEKKKQSSLKLAAAGDRAPALSDEQRLDLENQSWLEGLEGSGRCAGCGRTFERRAALVAHTHTCAPRRRALQQHSRRRRIQIQVRRDYHKDVPPAVTAGAVSAAADADNKVPEEESVPPPPELSEDAEAPPRPALGKEKELEAPPRPALGKEKEVEAPPRPALGKEKELEAPPRPALWKEKEVEAPPRPALGKEKEVEAPPRPLLEEATMYIDDEPEPGAAPEPAEPPPEVAAAGSSRRDTLARNTLALERRMRADTLARARRCLLCGAASARPSELRAHMAEHYGWARYACKLCAQRRYRLDDMTRHVRDAHRLQGDADFYCSTVRALDAAEALLPAASPQASPAQSPAQSPAHSPAHSPATSRAASPDSGGQQGAGAMVDSRKRRRVLLRRGSKRARRRQPGGDDEDVEQQKLGDITMDKVIMRVIFGDESPAAVAGQGPAGAAAADSASSELDDAEDKLAPRLISAALPRRSARPVRNKSKPKRQDFEYDLSNLLKMDAQGYREAQQQQPPRPAPAARRRPPSAPGTPGAPGSASPADVAPPPPPPPPPASRDFAYALLRLTKRSVELAAAQLRPRLVSLLRLHKQKPCYPFAKPTPPPRAKVSPKKQSPEEKTSDAPAGDGHDATECRAAPASPDTPDTPDTPASESKDPPANKDALAAKDSPDSHDVSVSKDLPADRDPPASESSSSAELATGPRAPRVVSVNGATTEGGAAPLKAMVPIKFRRQSLDIISNPIINRNLSDLTKAGMKTKILVIKPIKRNKDGTQSINPALKFQTIKLKDPTKTLENKSEVVLVKVPVVESVVRSTPVGEQDPATGTKVAAATPATPATPACARESVPTDDASTPELITKHCDTEIQSYNDLLQNETSVKEVPADGTNGNAVPQIGTDDN